MATFAVSLPVSDHIPNARLIATYSKKYSVANVFREIHEDIPKGLLVTCVGQFGAESYDIDFSSPLCDLNGEWEKNGKRTT
jgi:hypothetical protein